MNIFLCSKLIIKQTFPEAIFVIKSYGIFHTEGKGVDPISITFSGKINVFFKENSKDDQNDLIHPENL